MTPTGSSLPSFSTFDQSMIPHTPTLPIQHCLFITLLLYLSPMILTSAANFTAVKLPWFLSRTVNENWGPSIANWGLVKKLHNSSLLVPSTVSNHRIVDICFPVSWKVIKVEVGALVKDLAEGTHKRSRIKTLCNTIRVGTTTGPR